MQNLLYVNKKLGLCDPDEKTWQEIDERLVDYVLDENGMLCEFTDGNEAIDSRHRHLSHIYGLFPATLFDNDEKLREAAWKAVKKRHERGVSHASSWSMAWTACCASTMGDSDKACEFIDHIVKSGLMDNYLTSHNDWRKGSGYCYGKKIFQIDALFGISRAIANMFISGKEGYISIMPALPKFFPDGKICGICGYDGFSFDVAWENGCLFELNIYSSFGAELCIDIGKSKITQSSHGFSQNKGRCNFGFVSKGEKINIKFSK
jgi:alpha-L-fucosidase 2